MWKNEKIEAYNKQQRSERLLYKEGPISLEFLFFEGRIHGFIAVRSLPLPPLPNEPQTALLTVEIEGSTPEKCPLHLLRGSQKALLSEEWTKKLYTSLQQGETLSLSIGRYKSTIAPFNK